MENTQADATCITRGPEKGGLGAAQLYTRRPRGRAQYKDPDTVRRKQNGEALRQTKALPAKCDQTNNGQRHSQALYKDLD